MEKFCVFCGREPHIKTKEHVIPYWLIKLTGDAKRKARFGYDFKNGSSREYDFSSFTFPSCKECNNKLSDLEKSAKRIMKRVLSHEYICIDDLILFMDWLDKIRVGLWLAYYYLNNNACCIEPKFFINNRIRSSDRGLVIYKNNENGEGLNFIGTDTPLFQFMPSCFTLRVNNYYFLNISKEYFCSKGLGFPYTKKITLHDKNIHGYVLREGTNQTEYPVLGLDILSGAVEIYQPIFDMNMVTNSGKEIIDLYNNKYISENTYSSEEGIGVFSLILDGTIEALLNKRSEVKLEPNEKPLDIILKLPFEIQKLLYEETFDVSDRSHLAEDLQESLNKQKDVSMAFNTAVIKKIEEGKYC